VSQPAESYPIPQLAKTAMQLLQSQMQANLNQLAEQTVLAMGLDPKKGYNVNFDAGVIVFHAPSAAAPQPVLDPPSRTTPDV
jgi:hypothetical protein